MNLAKKLILFVLLFFLLVVAAFDIWGALTLGTRVPAADPVRDGNANRVVMVFGATGSVGDGLLKAAMEDPDVEKFTSSAGVPLRELSLVFRPARCS